MAYWPALAVGCVAQLVAAHCPHERILEVWTRSFQLDRPTCVPHSLPHSGLHPAMFFGNDSTHCFNSAYYHVYLYYLLLIYLIRRDGRLSLPEHLNTQCQSANNFHPNFGVFPLHQVAHVGVSKRIGLKLFGREIIFELFQTVWKTSLNVTDGRTDGRRIVSRRAIS